MRSLNEIIIHCSATPEGKDFTVNDIRRWHMEDRGWKDIGYHFVIYRDGSVHEGRPVSEEGAHCTGRNKNSIGICYIGGCAKDGIAPKDTRTPEQKKSLVDLIKSLKSKYGIKKVSGHRDYAKKACPSFDATNEYKNL